MFFVVKRLSEKISIAAFTGNRAEYGLLHPLLKAFSEEDLLDSYLIISGSHLADDYGYTVDEIDKSLVNGFFEIPLEVGQSDRRTAVLKSFSQIVDLATDAIRKIDPDLLILVGDRYETFAMGIAAYYSNIPIAHIFGGDLSQGGHLDDSVRHSITKLANLHFTTNQDSRDRVLGLGEEPWRVFDVGSTAIDNIVSGDFFNPEDLAKELKIDLKKPIILFTQHPVTTDSDYAYEQVKESLEALRELNYQTVITYPCDDAGSEQIIKAILEYGSVPNFIIRKNLGRKRYLGLLRVTSVVVGNSSSGIMETPFFKVPCVNVGPRQKGRLRAENVIDAPYDKVLIIKAIKRALSDQNFINEVKHCCNPYGDGNAAETIVGILKKMPAKEKLLKKQMTY